MPSLTNNPPYAVLNLTEEEHKFLLGNCESNIIFGLNALQIVTDEARARALVDTIESFKNISQKLKESVT